MQAIVKILMQYEATDDIAARKRFRQIVESVKPALPEDMDIRDFKMVEDGTGRLIAKEEQG